MSRRYIIGFFAAFVLLTCLASCGNRRTAALLRDVESYIQARPDSALATLLDIPAAYLATPKLKADYSLLYAMALDKCWIDTTDVEVVMPAVRYYSDRKPLQNRAKPYYYLGRIQFNGRDYEKAIVSFTRADEYSADMAEPRFKALLYQALSLTYNCCKSYEEALAYADSSYRYGLIAADTMLANSSLYSVAACLNNLKRYDEADSIYRLVLSDVPLYPKARLEAMADYALLLTNMKRYDEAVGLFEGVIGQKKSLGHLNQWGAYAYCLDRTGRKERADAIFRSLEKAGKQDNYSYLAWKSHVDAARSDYEEAYELISRALDEQKKNVNIVVKQSAIKAQRDYYQAQEELAKQGEALQSRVNVLLVALIVLLAITGAVVFFRYRDRMEMRASRERETLEREAEAVRQQLAVIEQDNTDRLSNLRKEYVLKYQEHFRELGRLYECYIQANGSRSASSSMLSAVKALAADIESDVQGGLQFESRIDDQMDGIMARFRRDFPDLTQSDYQLMRYTIAGFDATTISILTGQPSMSAIYTRKSRLKQAIINSTAADRDEYLLFFS